MASRFPGVAEVLHLDSVDSTQTLARTLAEQGARDRTLVWADRQTRGRGQFSRRWSSPAGGLYFSLILRPKIAPDELAGLSLATAEAAARALRDLTGLQMRIKPPNDVYASNGESSGKVCGVLVEASSRSRDVDWIIVGIGVNVDNEPPLKAAASLGGLTGKTWGAERVLSRVLEEFFRVVVAPSPE